MDAISMRRWYENKAMAKPLSANSEQKSLIPERAAGPKPDPMPLPI
jgi:hypothetical protein